MKRKFLVLLSLILVVVTALWSCNFGKTNDTDNEECEHTFSSSWSTNPSEHWHAATCEHSDQRSKAGAHSDADEDGKCDVCEYDVGHTHTFATEWQKDETHHWHEATCTHKSEKGDYSTHVDANANGECDACLAKLTVKIDPTDLDAVIAALLERSAAVNGGRILYNNVCTGAIDGSSEIAEAISYVFGNGSAYYTTTTLSKQGTSYVPVSVRENWYEQVSANEYFGAYRVDGEDFYLDPSANASSLMGYNFFLSTLTNTAGSENILYTLYNISQGTGASEYVFNYDEETGTYSFSFNCIVINEDVAEGTAADFYTVSVSFAHTENYVLTDLNILCECYTNSCEAEEDKDFVFNPTEGTIEMKPDAIADTYTFTVTQTVGDRTFVNEYGKDHFIPRDFDLFGDEERTEKLEGILEVYTDDTTYIYLGAFTPEGTAASYLADNFTVVIEGTTNYVAFALPIDNALLFNIKSMGEYRMVITVGSITKKIIIKSSQAPAVDPNDQPENTVAATITDTYSWIDLVTFTAEADGDYTFIIAEGLTLGACDKNIVDAMFAGGTPWADFQKTDEYGNNCLGGERTVSLKAGEVYSFYVQADKKGTYYIPYTVSAYTGSSIAGIDNSVVNGIWQYVVNGTTYFEFIFEDGLITVVETDYTGEFGLEPAYTYTFNTNSNVITVGDGNTAMFTYNGTNVIFGDYKLTKAPARLNLIMGNNKIEASDIDFSYKSDAKGTLTLIVGSSVNGDVTITYSVNGGKKVTLPLGAATDIALEEGDEIKIYVVASGYCSIDASFTETGANAPDPDGSKPLDMGVTQIEAENLTLVFNATANGNLTIQVGSAINGAVDVYYSINGAANVAIANSSTADITVNAGDKVIIKVIATGYSSIISSFTDSENILGSKNNPYKVEGTGSFEISAVYGDYVYVESVGGVTLTLDCSAKFYDENGNELGTVVVAEAGVLYRVSADYVAGCTGNIVATVDQDSDGNYPLVLGNNDIPKHNVVFKYVATMEGILTLDLGNAYGGQVDIVYTVNGDNSFNLYTDQTATTALYVGDVVIVRVTSEGTATLKASFEEEDLRDLPDEGEIKDISTVAGSGTSSDPYVITESGYYQTGSVNAYPGLYFSITADKDIVVTIYNDKPGIYSANGNYSLWAAPNSSYVKSIAEGETFTFILCIDQGTVDSSIIEVVIEEGIIIEEDSGSGGGETSDTAYVSSNGYMTVYLGTDAVILVWNDPKVGDDQATYYYSVNGSTVVLYDQNHNVVLGNEASLTLSADGAPQSVTIYGLYTYDGFTKA